jgi:hypothetical protein
MLEPVMAYWTRLFQSKMSQTMNMWQGVLLASVVLACCWTLARVLCKVSTYTYNTLFEDAVSRALQESSQSVSL